MVPAMQTAKTAPASRHARQPRESPCIGPTVTAGGGLGWARLANGTFVNPADGGCDGSVKAVEKWKAWLAAGYTSSTDAQKSK